MIYAPPFVFCPKGNPALGGSPPSASALRETPPSGVAPLRRSLHRLYPSIPPFLPLRNILSINHLERAKTLLPRAHSRSR